MRLKKQTKLWIWENILQGPMLSITGDALVGRVVWKEWTKLQLTSVFWFDLERQNIAGFRLGEAGKNISRFRLGKVAFYFLCLKNRAKKGQHRHKATYWSKHSPYKTLIPLAMYDVWAHNSPSRQMAPLSRPISPFTTHHFSLLPRLGRPSSFSCLLFSSMKEGGIAITNYDLLFELTRF
jgi:hypothetical protein